MITSTAVRHIRKPAEGWSYISSRQLSTPGSGLILGRRRLYRCDRPAARRFASTVNTGKNDRRDGRLPDSPARTRFAPSPTGYMHIGGLRTALFSYLLAKRTNGQFLLRIEDTDQKRLVPDAEERLCEDLNWAGLHWDEGPGVNGPFGPYRQSERTHIYQEHAQHLVDAGAAYRCFCTPQHAASRGAKAAFVTSGCYQDCSALPSAQAQERAESKREPFTVRLRRPANAHKRVYKDLIYGQIQRLKRSPLAGSDGEDEPGGDVADTILVKSDGIPTYHFANVVDDHLMQITHVIRGSEWMASTPLHYDLYTAFGWEPPAFAHVGLLVDQDRAKLSKRSNTGLVLDVKGMRELEGILPEVLCNFLALLGWKNPWKDDVFEMDQLIRDFDLKFTKGNTMVKMEKLWFLQKRHVAHRRERALSSSSRAPLTGIAKRVSDEVRSIYPDTNNFDSSHPRSLESFCADLLLVDFNSYQTPKQYVDRNRYFFTFNASEVPELQDVYGESSDLSGVNLAGFMKELMAEFDWTQPYRKTSVGQQVVAEVATTKPDENSLIYAIEQTATRVHAAIDLKIWERLLRKVVHEDSTHHPDVLPYTSDHVDITAVAGLIAKQGTTSGTDVDALTEDLAKQYKSWNKGLMRFLRERLSYGLPGPSVGHTMALLGYEECCRRLDTQPQKDMGW